MPKREDTVKIEKELARKTRHERIYGCEEVTIGFARGGFGGHGREIVDFMTMDSKDIFRCYEIKVTMEDLKSDAHKSFYGHYNYFAVTEELYKKIVKTGMNLSMYGIPGWAGILCFSPWGDRMQYTCVRNPKKQEIGERADMLKSSLVRTLYWKMEKYRGMADESTIRQYQKELRQSEKDRLSYREIILQARNSIARMRHAIEKEYGIRPDFSLESPAEEWIREMIKVVEAAGHKENR